MLLTLDDDSEPDVAVVKGTFAITPTTTRAAPPWLSKSPIPPGLWSAEEGRRLCPQRHPRILNLGKSTASRVMMPTPTYLVHHGWGHLFLGGTESADRNLSLRKIRTCPNL